MFSELRGNYKEQIIRYWRRYLNDKVMIVDAPAELNTVLADDPHETRFFIEQSVDRGSPDTESAPPLPASGDISGCVIFCTRNLYDSNHINKQRKQHLGYGRRYRIDRAATGQQVTFMSPIPSLFCYPRFF